MKKFFIVLVLSSIGWFGYSLHGLSKLSGALELHVLDVGQGDSLLLVTPEEHHILIDGGPGDSVLMQLSEVLPPAFREIDLLVLTHPHLDHMEGLIHVLDRFEVHAVLASLPEYPSLAYEAFLERLQRLGVPYYLAQADQDFRFGEVYLDVLYPFEPLLGAEMENVNNASPVIRVEYEDVGLMLSGDAEMEVEEDLLARYPPGDLEADYLKAGHHGSKTSNTKDFLSAVNPKVLLISCGKDNTYGHPALETLRAASELGIEVRRTDLEGSIHLIWR